MSYVYSAHYTVCTQCGVILCYYYYLPGHIITISDTLTSSHGKKFGNHRFREYRTRMSGLACVIFKGPQNSDRSQWLSVILFFKSLFYACAYICKKGRGGGIDSLIILNDIQKQGNSGELSIQKHNIHLVIFAFCVIRFLSHGQANITVNLKLIG